MPSGSNYRDQVPATVARLGRRLAVCGPAPDDARTSDAEPGMIALYDVASRQPLWSLPIELFLSTATGQLVKSLAMAGRRPRHPRRTGPRWRAGRRTRRPPPRAAPPVTGTANSSADSARVAQHPDSPPRTAATPAGGGPAVAGRNRRRLAVRLHLSPATGRSFANAMLLLPIPHCCWRRRLARRDEPSRAGALYAAMSERRVVRRTLARRSDYGAGSVQCRARMEGLNASPGAVTRSGWLVG